MSGGGLTTLPESWHGYCPRPLMAKILVIDDYPPVRELFAEALMSAGHDVITASDGSMGLALYAQHHPALVITDLELPGRPWARGSQASQPGTGIENHRCIREQPRESRTGPAARRSGDVDEALRHHPASNSRAAAGGRTTTSRQLKAPQGQVRDPMSEPSKRCLGDAAYIDMDQWNRVVLTTEDGYQATNTIVLESTALAQLVRWLYEYCPEYIELTRARFRPLAAAEPEPRIQTQRDTISTRAVAAFDARLGVGADNHGGFGPV